MSFVDVIKKHNPEEMKKLNERIDGYLQLKTLEGLTKEQKKEFRTFHKKYYAILYDRYNKHIRKDYYNRKRLELNHRRREIKKLMLVLIDE